MGEQDSLLERADVRPGVASPRLSYQPALDGLRAVAVVLVVVFHLDVGLFRGGYLGVSLFFTLSGFLITSLLLDESRARSSSGRSTVDLGRFYVRRLKRLLPASMATLLAVVVLAAVGIVTTTAQLRGDITAAAWNVFNWRELLSGDSYADLFADESPVAHFWSLAIEEQFYVIWPLTLVVLIRLFGTGRRPLLMALGAMFALSALSAILASSDVAYFATHTRAAEILTGALLATWMATARSGTWPSWWRSLGAPALALIVVLAVVTPTTGGWAYSGGLPFFAVVSAALIAGLQAPGPVTSMLSIAPLVALGRISYGVYLVHWPVFVVLDERRLGTDGWSLASIRLVVTLAIAVAMFVVIERPIRTAPRRLRPMAVVAAAVVAMLGVTVAAATLLPDRSATESAPQVLGSPSVAAARPGPGTGGAGSAEASTRAAADGLPVSASASRPAVEFVEPAVDPAVDSAVDPGVVPGDEPVVEPAPLPVVEPVVEGPVTIAVFGDSVPAWLLRDAAASYTRTDAVLLNGAMEGCDGMVGAPIGRDRRAGEFAVPDGCFEWPTTYPATLATAARTDVGLLVLGQAPVVDRYVDGRWQGPCESIDWYVRDVTARIEYLRSVGVRPVLAIPARFGARVTYIVTDDHRQRIDCIRWALAGAAADLDVDVIDLDGLLCPGDDCEVLRTIDGVHVDPDAAPGVLNALVDRVLDTWRSQTPPSASAGR